MASLLVVEDSSSLRDFLLQMLRLDGYDALGAADGEEGWGLLENGLRPSVILLDFQMPVTKGRAFLRALRGSPDPALAKMPVVLCSATLDRAADFLEFADAVLPKPVHLETLLETVARVLRANAVSPA